MSHENHPIVYAVKTINYGEEVVVFRTKSFSGAEKFRKELKQFNKPAWVDLETENGDPHPYLE